MRIVLLGASGFIGSAILGTLLRDEELEVTALSRRPGPAVPAGKPVRVVPGNVLRPADVQQALRGADAVVNAVGIIAERGGSNTFERVHVEAVRNLLDAADATGTRRVIHLSAQGARPSAPSRYHRTKHRGEELLRASSLEWTIVRPSVVFGPRDRFLNLLAGQVRRLPVIPIAGPGHNRFQPVYVEDVAAAVQRCLRDSVAIGEVIACGGPSQLSYNELMAMLKRILGLPRKRVVHLPLGLLGLAALVPGFPLTRDQWLLLQEDNVLSGSEYAHFRQVLGRTPAALEEVLPGYLQPYSITET